jgi:hypothetical protein
MSAADDLFRAQAKLEALRQLEHDGVKIPTPTMQEAEKAAGVFDPNRLRVTQEQIAPGASWLKENRAEFNRALAEGRVEVVD